VIAERRCGQPIKRLGTLREASREQVEGFVTHLADWAEKERNALLCQLNSYLGSKEGWHEPPDG
jgi:hypothetical protein